jgi:putative CRISPR-associated protein (TIGR02620 family)
VTIKYAISTAVENVLKSEDEGPCEAGEAKPIEEESPQKYFVTRHLGAITWFLEMGHRARKIEMKNFDVAGVAPGDVVIGTLPVHLVAQVCALGGQYWHLAMEIPPQSRGHELTADDMRNFGARLQQFHVEDLGLRTSPTPTVQDQPGSAPLGISGDTSADAAAAGSPVLHVCVATGEPLCNLLPLLQLRWDVLVIAETPEMAAQALHLEQLAKAVALRRQGGGSPAQVLRRPVASPKGLAAIGAEMRRLANALALEFAGFETVVNATGGIKLMFLPLLEAFRPRARILYCDTLNDCLEAIAPRSSTTVALPPDLLDLETLLRGQHTRIVTQQALGPDVLAQMRSRLRATATLVHSGGVSGPAGSLVPLLHKLAHAALPSRDGRGQTPPFAAVQSSTTHLQHLKPLQKRLLRELLDLGLLVRWWLQAGVFDVEFSSPEAASYLAGGYLEEFAVLCLDDLGLPAGAYGSRVQVDVLRPSAGRQPGQMNEIDAALVWRNRLLVLECKAGSQLFEAGKSQEIVNKLGRLRGLAGPFGSAWMLSRKLVEPEPYALVLDRMAALRIDAVSGPGELFALPQRLRTWCGEGLAASALDWPAAVL